MLKEIAHESFANGNVYLLETEDGFPIEVTDTFLPYYTKDAIGKHQNKLQGNEIGSRGERWMIGVSCMSGCFVGCKFCETGDLDQFRSLTSEEIVQQVENIIDRVQHHPEKCKEFKINYTRMGEPFLNITNVRDAISEIDRRYPNVHHYISTIGVRHSDFSWIKDNITLQLSLHSLNEHRRDGLIPYTAKMSIAELGQVRTQSNLKTTINLTLVDEADFDITELEKYFDPQFFFIKLSPINTNAVSEKNKLGRGVIEGINLI